MTDAADEAPTPLEVVASAAIGTDVGCVREHNEDAAFGADLGGEPWLTRATAPLGPRGMVVLVCDGMGGVAGGEVAAAQAVESTWRELRSANLAGNPEVAARLLRRAVRAANLDVWTRGRATPGLRGMGTTISAAVVVGDALVIAQVGDSRIYVHRRGVLTQVTRDQSLVSALQAAGMLGHGQRPTPQAAGAILQALGVTDDVEPSLSIVPLRNGDRVLVCSDGLHGLVEPATLGIVLATRAPVDEVTARLIAAAREAGGHDNITAEVIDIEAGLPPPRDARDQPEFAEFDPQEEGDGAMSTTSTVARRLASRIGLGRDPGRRVPSTGQHATIPASLPDLSPAPAPASDVAGPATVQLQGGARGWQGWLWWGLAAVIVGIIAWLVAR